MKTLILAAIRCSLSFTAAAAFCIVQPAKAGTVTFTDGTFNLANYSEMVFTTSPSDTVSFTQCSTCGNPGQALQIMITLPAAGDLGVVGFINNTFAYNPATQGAIATIAASVDKILILNQPFGFNTFRPLIEQDGLFYLAAIPGPPTTGYHTISQGGLTATSFTQFDFSTGTFGSAHPNFAGDLMLFGLAQLSQSDAPNLQAEVDYDNLNLSINSVPETGSTILLLWPCLVLLVGLQMHPRYRTCS
jgi:hypothetical protein